MNLYKFNERFTVTGRMPRTMRGSTGWLDNEDPTSEFKSFIDGYGGLVFEGGLYRIHNPESIDIWNAKIREAYPQVGGQVQAFGQDWQGNQFALRVKPNPYVLLFQVGSGAVFEIASSIESAHELEFVEHTDEALSVKLWHQWVSNGGERPSVNQCVGLQQPLFLGGENRVENMCLCNVDVYWEIASQLLQQVRKLPPGTPISNIRFEGTSARIQ
jgi:Domain of unknown function (DUF1851)